MRSSNFSRGVLLDGVLLISRLMQCLVMTHRSLVEARLPGSMIMQTLADWLQEFRYPPTKMQPELMQRHPLKDYNVEVRPEPERSGWYEITIDLRPIDAFRGAAISLTLVGEEFS